MGQGLACFHDLQLIHRFSRSCLHEEHYSVISCFQASPVLSFFL